MRVVSMIPAATEIVARLGCADWLVGRSHECDFPPEVEPLPVCTSAQIDASQPSAAIDRSVKALLDQALSIYQVDAALLSRLRPDLIITQSQCDVCAVSPRDVERALGSQAGSRPRLLSLAPQALEDVFDGVRQIAEALGVAGRGAALTRELRQRLDATAARAAAFTNRPAVACVEWIEPLMGAGNWIPELVELAGGRPLLGRAGEHSGWIRFADLAEARADVIIFMPCGFSMARTLAEVQPLMDDAGWRQLPAFKSHEVYVADGHHYFNRPGPRLADSAEILAEILWPHEGARHEGHGWRRVEFGFKHGP